MLQIVGSEPVFETGLLLVGDVRRADIERQLSRWVRAGRIAKLRRGVYALAAPYAKVVSHPFHTANRLARGSYVSLESALAFHGLIPEHVPITTSVSPRAPARVATALGTFSFRHLHPTLCWGYTQVEVFRDQLAFVATAEKALLDWTHLRKGGDRREAIESLRLHNLDTLDLEWLAAAAKRADRPKIHRAAAQIARVAQLEAYEVSDL